MSHEHIERPGLFHSGPDDLQAVDGRVACGYCATNSGIYDITARCCRVRLVANMPRRLRLAYYGRLQREFGADVARDMAEAVKLFHAKREEATA